MSKDLIDVIESLLSEGANDKINNTTSDNQKKQKEQGSSADTQGVLGKTSGAALDGGGDKDVGAMGKGKFASDASSDTQGTMGKTKGAALDAGGDKDVGKIDGKKALPSGASSKVEADKGPHSLATDKGLGEELSEEEAFELISALDLEDIEGFMQTEEFESLDEISKQALMNYRGSAKIHRRQNDEIIGSQMASNSQVNKAEKDNEKRTKGIDMTAKKLAIKEEEDFDDGSDWVAIDEETGEELPEEEFEKISEWVMEEESEELEEAQTDKEKASSAAGGSKKGSAAAQMRDALTRHANDPTKNTKVSLSGPGGKKLSFVRKPEHGGKYGSKKGSLLDNSLKKTTSAFSYDKASKKPDDDATKKTVTKINKVKSENEPHSTHPKGGQVKTDKTGGNPSGKPDKATGYGSVARGGDKDQTSMAAGSKVAVKKLSPGRADVYGALQKSAKRAPKGTTKDKMGDVKKESFYVEEWDEIITEEEMTMLEQEGYTFEINEAEGETLKKVSGEANRKHRPEHEKGDNAPETKQEPFSGHKPHDQASDPMETPSKANPKKKISETHFYIEELDMVVPEYALDALVEEGFDLYAEEIDVFEEFEDLEEAADKEVKDMSSLEGPRTLDPNNRFKTNRVGIKKGYTSDAGVRDTLQRKADFDSRSNAKTTSRWAQASAQDEPAKKKSFTPTIVGTNSPVALQMKRRADNIAKLKAIKAKVDAKMSQQKEETEAFDLNALREFIENGGVLTQINVLDLEEKKDKPDFLDMDGDDDKKESMKKAVDDKEKDDTKKESFEFGEESISEDFKARAEVIFETAVNEKASMIREELEEEFESQLTEAKAELDEKVAAYVEEAVAEWVKENSLEIKYSLRTEIAENFIRGLKGLFEDSYIEIPEEDYAVVDELTEAVESYKEQLESQTSSLTEARAELLSMKRSSIVETLSDDLTETQKIKLESLAEHVEAADIEEFETKVKELKEGYFDPKSEQPFLGSLTEEVFTGSMHEINENVDPSVAVYANFLGKALK